VPSDHLVARVGAQVADRFERTLEGAEVLDRIPGRSVSLAGLGLMGVAIALTLLPLFSGIGPVWSVLMLAGGLVVAAGELRAAGKPLPGVRIPPALQSPLVAPAFAALVSLHAFQLLRVGIVPLLWVAAAVLLGWDQARKARLAPESFGRRFDLALAWRGYRRNVSAGVALCMTSLFFTWGASSGYFTGGYSYNYAYRSDGSGNYGYGYAYDYSPAQYYWPGWEMSGRNQSFAILIEAILLALVVWAALRREGQGSPAFRLFAPSAGLVLFGWWWMNASSGIGIWLFFAGLVSIGSGAFRILRGEDEGRYDLAHLAARGRAMVAARRRG
jgi:hypothetical protein